MNLETILRPYLDVYKTPPGHVDEPYIITYSPPSTTPIDSTILNAFVPVNNGSFYYDFLLRRVVGLDSVIDTGSQAGQYTLQTDGTNNLSSNPISVATSGLDFLVVPEILFASNSQIGLSLYNTFIRNNNSGGQTLYYGQVGFCGIRRRVGTLAKPGIPYRLVPWQQTLTVVINWSGLDAGNNPVPPVKYFVNVNDLDTEIYTMQVLDPNYTPGPNSQSSCALTLYNAQKLQLSSSPVVASYMSANAPWGNQFGSGSTIADKSYLGGGTFVPTLLYPQESQIQIDVTSLLLTAQLPVTVTITLTGAQRFPC